MAMEVSGIILGGANAASGSGASKLSDLTDVSIQGTLAEGQNLRYNSALKLWQNSEITPDIYQYIQENLQGTNGVTVSSASGKHTITFGFTANGDVRPVNVVDNILDLQLVDVNTAPGRYGGATMIPVVTVDAKGRVIQITTEAVATGSGTVSYVAMTGGSTGLTVTGGPIMTSGTLTLGGCLNVSAGGTGAVQLTGYIRGNGTQPFTAVSAIPGSDVNGDIAGAAGSAAKLKTARKLTIGDAARNFDGSADISWSLSAIGAVSKTGDTMAGPLTLSGDPTNPLHSVTKRYVDTRDYLNKYPQAGYVLGENEVPIYSDFKFSFGAPATFSFSVIDKDSKNVIYYSATTPLGKPSVFRAYRYSLTDEFIFDNDPIELTSLAPGEMVKSFLNVGTNFIVAMIGSNTAPWDTLRISIIKTAGSSKCGEWVEVYDVTSISSGVYNFALLEDLGGDRILKITQDAVGTTLGIYNTSLELLRSQLLYSTTTDVNPSDTTAAGRTGAFVSFGYKPYNTAHAFTWNPITETLHQKNPGFYTQTTLSGERQGVGFALSISWKIPKSWILTGTGTNENLIPIKSGAYRYNLYSDSTWDTTEGGMSIGLGKDGNAISIVTDEYSGDMHYTLKGSWDNIFAGSVSRIKAGKVYKTFGNSIASAIVDTKIVKIPDGSYWSKNINPSATLIIGNQIDFIGTSARYGTKQIYTQFSTTDIATVVSNKDTLKLDSVNAIVGAESTMPASIAANREPGRFSVSVAGGSPVYCWIMPGNKLYTAAASGVTRIWTATSLTVPAVPTAIGAITGLTSQANTVWNGDTSAPVYWALVKNSSSFYIAKCDNGVWSIPSGAPVLQAQVDAGNTLRGDTANTGSANISTTLLTESGKIIFDFEIPYPDGKTLYTAIYDTVTHTYTAKTLVPFNSATTGDTGQYTAIWQYSGASYGYNTYLGYYAIHSANNGSHICLMCSKDITGLGTELTEAAWLAEGAQRYELFITTENATGLVAYVSEYPLFIGGYYTSTPATTIALKPNVLNHVYVEKTNDSRDSVRVFTTTDLLTDSFSRLRIAAINTSATNAVAMSTFAFDGAGLPSQVGNSGKVLATTGKYTYWKTDETNASNFESTPGTYTSVTVDSFGRVTAGTNLTTIDEYGIIDGVKKTGDTMAGPLVLSGNPTENLHAVPKQYLDQQVSISAPIGLAGQVPYVREDNTRIAEPGYILYDGQFVSNDAELATAKTRIVDQASIFNSWTRFSHISTDETQPAIPAELTGWSYLDGVITSTVNSQSYIGFISSERYQSYTHEVRLASTAADDDAIGVVLAWYKDPVTSREYTLSAIRSPGGLANLTAWTVSTWSIVYNFSRSDAWVVASGVLSVKWGNGAYGADAAAAGYITNQELGGWDDFGAVGTKVRVVRDGDILIAQTTDLGTDVYIPESLLTVDLTSDARLEKFRGAAPIGYSCASQSSSSFTVLELTDPKTTIYDVRDGSVWRYTDATNWVKSATDTIASEIGVGRLLLDSYTRNMYFVQPDSIITVNKSTAATYSQTIAAGSFYEIDAHAEFGTHVDARSLSVQATVLDIQAGSPTQGMYINSEAVASVAVKDNQYIRVYNDYTASLDFFITVKR